MNFDHSKAPENLDAVHSFDDDYDASEHLVTLDLSNPAHFSFALHSKVDMHERIVFQHQPHNKTTLEYLQRYVDYFGDRAWEHSRMKATADNEYIPWLESITITLDNEPAYTGSVADVPGDVLIDRLPHAKCFSIDFYMSGALPVYYDNPDKDAAFCAIDESELWQGRGMADYLETLNGKEEFVYTGIFRYPDDDAHTEFVCIRDGQALNPEDLCTPDIAQRAAGCRFFGDRVTMYAAFDFKAHPQIVQQLREAVHDYVSDIEYTDTMLILWEENDECGDSGYLLSGCDIEDDDLSKSQQFADRVNQILAPIADQCTIYMNYSVWCDKVKPDPTVPSLYHCFHDMQHLAMASFVWADNKLQLVGKIL